MGLHQLSARWRKYLPADAETLPELTPLERIVLNNIEIVGDNITLDALAILHPYLPQDQARKVLDSLVNKQVIERNREHFYRFTAKTQRYMTDIGQALLAYAEMLNVVPMDQAYRLAVLTAALIDKLTHSPQLFQMPIFSLALKAMTPSEHPLGQVQQRLMALMALRDDAHIAAWRAEQYSPVGIRVASHLFSLSESSPIEAFLKSPLFFDHAYVRTGLDELQQRGDLLDTGVGYTLTAKGTVRRERVEHLTEEYFAHPFEKLLTETGRKDWLLLMNSLVDTTKTTQTLAL